MAFRIDEMGFSGLKIKQNDDMFSYGIDAVILADFASKLVPRAKKVMDMGTGNGAISLILTHKLPASSIDSIEVQKKAADLASENVELNGLEDRMRVVNLDVRDICSEEAKDMGILPGSYDLVVSNPPYMEGGSEMISEVSEVAIARHEVLGGLEDFFKGASRMLKNKGSLCMVHRPWRLVDLMELARRHHLEAKEMRLVAPRVGDDFNLVLIRYTKNGGKELKVMNPLYVYDEMEYTEEIKGIYEI